ncbi:MAG: hypothetical protein J5965_14495 [Aeriscardovia sp.]|jgi:hypothetical protein|nr:hypothetical protein [Aeriscardovia sp.]
MATDRGKTICKKLKRIRKEIAIINDIVLKQTICTNNEPCIGTCPICEAELLYLEQELDKKRNNGFEVYIKDICKDISPETITIEESQRGITAKSLLNRL